MTAEEELVKENNKKRKQLNKENLTYYEDMLIYIRLSFSKSDLETEEVLSELLDHLLDAQHSGKTAHDVFGDDPKQYAKDIVGALPQKIPKNFVKNIIMGALFFLGASTAFGGLLDLILYHGFSLGTANTVLHIGTFIIKTVISIPVAFLMIYGFVLYLRWSIFKHIKKLYEFFIFWVFGIISVGVFVLIFIFIPDFGTVFQYPHWVQLIAGVVLLSLGWYTLKKI